MIHLKGIDEQLFILQKGKYGHYHMGRIDSAIELLNIATLYTGHNIFTLYDALLRLALTVLDKDENHRLFRKMFGKNGGMTYISLSEVCQDILDEITNCLVMDGDKILINYNPNPVPEYYAHLEETKFKKESL